MTTQCPECGESFERVGTHWSRSSGCEYPPLTQKQRNITTGLLMGDGYIDMHQSGNPVLRLEMITQEYLQYIDEKFGILGTGVSLRMRKEESAKRVRNNGFDTNANPQNYSDLYIWRSRHHPEFEEFSEWYSSGEKVWPQDIVLTPTVMKHWYCCDGNWDNSGARSYIEISMSNEREHTEKVSRLFESSGLPSPSNYTFSERKDGSKRCSASFTIEQSKELWEYMGEPLPGFEYKWPDEYKS